VDEYVSEFEHQDGRNLWSQVYQFTPQELFDDFAAYAGALEPPVVLIRGDITEQDALETLAANYVRAALAMWSFEEPGAAGPDEEFIDQMLDADHEDHRNTILEAAGKLLAQPVAAAPATPAPPAEPAAPLRPTQVVRRLMSDAGKDPVITNTYDKCWTVKCYRARSSDKALMEKLKAHAALNGWTVKTTPNNRINPYMTGGIIVRIPR
jgi:hypothetical protein